MQRVVVIDALKAGQQHFAFIHRRIEAQVSIDVGVDDEVGRLGDDHLVVDDCDAERRDQARLLHEGMRLVGFAVPVGVLQHDDAIAFGLTGMMGAITNTLGHPDAPVAIDVDVRRVVQQRETRPTALPPTLRAAGTGREELAGTGQQKPGPPAWEAARKPAAARRPSVSARASRSVVRGQIDA